MFEAALENIIFSPALLSTTSAILVLWLLFRAIRSYFRLRHVPGPFWASLTGFWVGLQTWRGVNFADICNRLDQEYGPVVRYGPKNVLFSDPSVIPTIYGTTHPWRKAVSYEPAMVVLNGKPTASLVTTRQEEYVSTIKRHINYAFTAKAVSDYEPQVDDTIREMDNRISSSEPTVDLNKWIKLYAFESICKIAFSDGEFSEKDLQETLLGMKERFDHWSDWFSLPDWEKFLYRNRLWLKNGGPSKLLIKAVARVKERQASGRVTEQGDLLDRYLQANQKAPEDFDTHTVIGLVLSVITAGAETVAATMVNTMYFLISHPSAHAALLRELEAANLASPPTFQSVSRLPYLEAAIKETMRINSVMTTPLEREVPEGGAQIAGYHIPAGTAVAVNDKALARSEIWGPEPEAFRPERWIETDDARRMKMERAWIGFGQGKRMCIGKHIAWMEMKKAIPELLLNYKFELLYPGKPLRCHTKIVAIPQDMMLKVESRHRPK